MNKYVYISLLVLLFTVQIFVPAQMIYQQEQTIKTGAAYKFKTEPIDPNDPFRGKFITLRYEVNSFKSEEENWSENTNVYVYLKTDDEGFAAIKTISKAKIDMQNDYVIAKCDYVFNGNIRIDYPFDRFYMNEDKAYDAEISVRQAQIDTTKTCYALVYVKEGTAVLDNVFIDDTPIKQYVEDYQKKQD